MKKFMLLHGEAKEVLKNIPDNTFHTVVTSPPYWALRDYDADGQLGAEQTPEEYVVNLVKIMREVKRTLRDDGTLWLNIGDTYNNSSGFCRATNGWDRKGRNSGSADKKALKHDVVKIKELFGIPWKVAFALQEDGWYLRCDIVWNKTNPMPDGAKDRPTHGHEYIFLLSKKPKYFYDYYGVLEDTKSTPDRVQTFGAREQEGTFRQDQNRTFEHYGKRNKRSVWETSVSTFRGNHFATYPPQLIEPCILASTSPEGCCADCGSPLVRITEKEKEEANNSKGYELKIISKGWEKSCDCETTKTKPCLVLDPFSGMATTGVVAFKHLRNYVGIELNKDYLKISRERLYNAGGKNDNTMFIEEVDSIEEF